MSRTSILVPCYKRPEYTAQCIKSLEESQAYNNTIFHLVNDGSEDSTQSILEASTLPKIVLNHKVSVGLRSIIIDFFHTTLDTDYIVKLDNDCLVPKDYVSLITQALDRLPLDIVSPNVYPSNAAYTYGKDGIGYRPSNTVGGLWAMKASLLTDINFESYYVTGIRGAYQLLNQIILEKEPRIGWLPDITVQDIGHWSGNHPLHIASEDHQAYSAEIGRRIAWSL